jgi:Leucine-rich repeat (LRR) protein
MVKLSYPRSEVSEVLISESGETILVTRNEQIATGVKWETITKLDLSYNQLTTLPPLPRGLLKLWCHYNQLTTLPPLPQGLLEVWCSSNQLVTLPLLPRGLLKLWCPHNQLTTLPPLPQGLLVLWCAYNQLMTLPPLPQGLLVLWCAYNQLMTLPPLPQGLLEMGCDSNPFLEGVDRVTIPLDLRVKIPLTAYATYGRLEREAKEATKFSFGRVLSELEATPL